MATDDKRIGTYLVENGACGQVDVDHALEVQSGLERSGHYKATGEILIEQGQLVPVELDKGLQRQYVDILSASELFKSFSKELLLKVARVAEDLVLKKGTIVFEQNDPGNTFYMVITGSVKVYRKGSSGSQTALAQLSSGSGFGEMALLTGEPRSASVRTLENSRLLVIDKNNFDQVAAANPEMSVALAKFLAERLQAGNVNLDRASATEKAYQRFVSEYQSGPYLDLVGESNVARKLRDDIIKIASFDQPTFITGPAGTEKKHVGWQIHKHKLGIGKPFLVIDAKSVNIGGHGLASDNDTVNRELAQASTLFGHRHGSLPFANHDRLGLLKVANDGTVLIENAEYLTDAIQEKLARYIKDGFFLPLGGTDPIKVSTRIIFTTSLSIDDSGNNELLADELISLTEDRIISVPSLRSHKKDLRSIVDYLVNHYALLADKTISEITREVYEEIMAYDWPGNMEELEVVIKRGVNLSREGRLTPEDLFIGRMPASGKYTLNLLKSRKLHQILSSRYYPGIGQTIIAAFFLLIFFLGFFGDRNPDKNISLVLTWGLWEPVVFLFAIFLGRLWCGFCPIGELSSILSNNVGLKMKVPNFIRNYGLYLSGFGLLTIYWAEVASKMVFSPKATALLLTAITLSAVMVGLLFQRRTWCRYLCPLGRYIGVLSSCSVLELRAIYAVCNNECLDHACYIGGDNQAPGCPMFEGPFALRSNIDCIFCGNCLRNCQNQSPRLNLRLPGHELWSGARTEPVVVFFVPLVLATQFFRLIEEAGFLDPLLKRVDNTWLFLALFLCLLTVLMISYCKVSSKFIVSESGIDPAKKQDFLAGSLLVLAASFEIGFYSERFLTLAGLFFQVLGKQFGWTWEMPAAIASLWAIKSLQVIFIIIGALAALATLREMQKKSSRDESQSVPFWRLSIMVPAVLYILLFLIG